MSAAQVVIGVPTFRRPQWLERCLMSLAKQTFDQPIRIIVADNDSEKREGIATCERLVKEGYPHPLTAVSVEHRGIAPTRNRLVSEAIADQQIQFIAMIDDDEWAEAAWLSELLRVQKAYDADVVGGPVMRVFETPVPDYLAKANQAHRRETRTGEIDHVDATNNILLRASLFRESPEPWFDPQYALMGGEDKDILLSFKLAGRTYAWAANAVVTEELPASRCSAKWLIKRAYSVGNTDTMINLKHRPPGFGFASEAAKIFGGFGIAAIKMTLLCWHPQLRFEGVRLAARVVGKLVALTGGRHEEYKVVHGR